MPLALLLQQSSRALARGGEGLAGWSELVRLEATLVARARSAFLARWFGSRLPLEGLQLRLAIDNLAALRARFQVVSAASQPPAAEGLDIGAPIAATLGTALGSAVSPLTALAIAIAGALEAVWWTLTFLLALALPLLAYAIGPLGWLIFGGLVLSLPLALSPLLLSSPAALNEGYPLLLAAGALMPPLVAFLDALTENWEAIFGSLIRLLTPLLERLAQGQPTFRRPQEQWFALFDALTPLAERLAVLSPLLLNALGLFIVTLGPLLLPLAAVLPAFLTFVMAAVEALRLLFHDFLRALQTTFQENAAGFRAVGQGLAGMKSLLDAAGGRFQHLFDEGRGFLARRWPALRSALIGWKDLFLQRLATLQSHPTLVNIRAFIENAKRVIDAMRQAVTAATRTAAEEVGGALAGPLGRRAGRELFERLRSRLGGGPPTDLGAWIVEHLPALPDLRQVRARLAPALTLEEALPAYSSAEFEAPSIPASLLRRQSIFAAERNALQAEIRRERDALAAARRQERQLRGFLFDIVARLLPPSVGASLERLRGLLETLDRQLAPDLPLRALPESDRLHPVVGRVRLHIPQDVPEEQARRWAADLFGELNRQTYRVGS